MKFLCLLLSAWLGFMMQSAVGQTPGSTNPGAAKLPVHLHLKTRNYGDHIVLRWGFSEAQAWRYLNKQGYILERYELDNATNKAINGQFKSLSSGPMRPWTKEGWASRNIATDTFAVVAAGCLLSESKIPADASFLKQMDLKSKDDANRTGFALFAADMSALAAEGLALRFEDRDVKADRKYIYRLRVQDDPNDRFLTDTALYVVSTDNVLPQLPPDAPEIQPGDTLLTLRWLKNPEFTAYHVERSMDGGASWQRLTRRPFLNAGKPKDGDERYISYPDKVPQNYKKYRYRIIGITPFAEESAPSAYTEAESLDLTPSVVPIVTKAENTTGKIVKIGWQVPPANDIQGFIVSKSTSVEGPWTPLSDKLLGPEQRLITDTSANEFGRNFYRVFSVDDHGNTAGSNPAYVVMNNNEPPAAPKWLDGKVDTNGVVTLRWRLGSEPDIWGYQIYYANQGDHEFIPLTGNVLEDTVYTYKIPLENLTEEIFYALRAVDVNYHISPMSEKMRLVKPDKVPPVSPVFQDFTVRDTGILLVFAPSSSRDVVKHFLLRRESGQTNWQTLAELSATETRYFDHDVTQKTDYEYTVYAVDDAGLTSPKSFPLHARALPIVLRAPIEDLNCTFNADKNTARLTWSYPEKSPNKIYFRVYRVAENGSLKLLGEVAGGQAGYEDKNLKKGASLRYAVRAFYKEGGASPVARTEALRI